jgi:hypothetical protein
MSFKRPITAVAAAALCVVAGSASVSAQENCGFLYQRVMEAYQAQSPYYSRIVNHYNARCLSGSSQPAWGGQRYQYDRDQGYGGDHWRRGW